MPEHPTIWSAFRSGDEEGFSRLFHDHYEKLYHYGRKLARDEELVKDVIQDFFLALFESRESLAEEVDQPTAYLLISFRRRLLREMNGRRAETGLLENQSDPAFVTGIEDILVQKESRELNRRTAARLLKELPPRQKEILYLKYYMDLSLPEIADTLAISYQVVANHLHRGLKKLRTRHKAKRLVGDGLWFLFL